MRRVDQAGRVPWTPHGQERPLCWDVWREEACVPHREPGKAHPLQREGKLRALRQSVLGAQEERSGQRGPKRGAERGTSLPGMRS